MRGRPEKSGTMLLNVCMNRSGLRFRSPRPNLSLALDMALPKLSDCLWKDLMPESMTRPGVEMTWSIVGIRNLGRLMLLLSKRPAKGPTIGDDSVLSSRAANTTTTSVLNASFILMCLLEDGKYILSGKPKSTFPGEDYHSSSNYFFYFRQVLFMNEGL